LLTEAPPKKLHILFILFIDYDIWPKLHTVPGNLQSARTSLSLVLLAYPYLILCKVVFAGLSLVLRKEEGQCWSNRIRRVTFVTLLHLLSTSELEFMNMEGEPH
jgi:ABC-type uncharacterized transport system YnjBCD ATPase subunit